MTAENKNQTYSSYKIHHLSTQIQNIKFEKPRLFRSLSQTYHVMLSQKMRISTNYGFKIIIVLSYLNKR